MSSNNDNAMTRFLFAILKQKNLKDINWEQVAHDPVLLQPITNGHAARMRYSRFKSSILGQEPTKRNRTASPTSKVTKSKKTSKAKKQDNVKIESPAPASPYGTSPEPLLPNSQRIKQESPPYTYNNRMTPALTPGPVSMSPTTISSTTMMQNRFLTPCSDTDAFAASPVLAPSPASDLIHSQTSFDFHAPPCPDHVDPTWTQANSYFAAAYPYEEYTNAACDHQHLQPSLHPQCPLGLPSQPAENDLEQVDIKQEEWTQYD
ncbi:hypothetical protein F5Y08DRAFT_11178 [Xylaria arbuscula]|nr:hypothetical protein F5Y08DRAFT_11178 [Xylaria arbuscula]